MSETADHSSRRLLLVAAIATAAFGLAMAGRVPVGIPGQWVWRPNDLPVHLWPAGVAALLLVCVAWLICRPGWWARSRPAARAVALALLILCAFLVQLGLLNAIGVPWVYPGAVIASPVATTYYSVSLEVRDPAQWVASYPQVMHLLPYHARTHPPGLVLFFIGLRRLCAALIPEPPPILTEIARAYEEFGIGPTPADAAAAIVAPIIISLLGALCLWPLYLLVRALVGPEAGICAAALVAGVPSLLLFGASPDLIVLALAVGAAWLSYSAWQSASPLRPFLAGLLLALGLFVSLGLLTLVAWLAVWALLGVLKSPGRRAAVRRLALGGIAAAFGVVVFYTVLHLAVGYRPFAVAREALFAHRGVTTAETARTYWLWVLLNPVEAALFAGLPLVVCALWSTRGLSGRADLRPLRTFLLSWLIVVALLDLSGTVRGEVGRIWLFLLWPAALAAGAWLADRPHRAGLVAALLALQLWQVLLMRGYLTVYDIF